MKKWFSAIILPSLFIFSNPAYSKNTISGSNALIIDPNITQPSPFENWKTLITPHFRINYQEKHFEFAQRMAIIAEKVNDKFAPFMKWQPPGRTEIVINDTVDNSNGGATPLPYNQFFIYMNTPTNGELLDHTGWIEQVFTHEYIHILHLDQSTGGPSVVRNIFGKPPGLLAFFVIPEGFAPSWVAEGIAVYNESLNGLGRGNNAIFESKMRQEILTDFRSYTEESYEGRSNSRWPFGQIYLYGTYFYEFIRDKYGEEKVIEYITNYNNNLIPWRMDSRAKDTFGINNNVLWWQFQEYLKARFSQQIKDIEANGIMAGTVIVDDDYENQFITGGPNNSIYYYHNDAVNPLTINQAFPNGDQKEITELIGVNYLDWNKNGGLIIGKSVVCGNTNINIDIFVMNSESKKIERITHCARLTNARWNASGDKIIATEVEAGKMSLVEVTINGEVKSLSNLPYGDAIGRLDISPNGKLIVASVKRSISGWNLEEFNLETTVWRKLTHSRSLERQPRYALNGRDVFYIADSKYQLEVKKLNSFSNEISTLTNSLGYIKEYLPTTDGGLWVVEYTGENEQIRYIPKTTEYGKIEKNIKNPINLNSLMTAQADFKPEEIPPGEDYSMWGSITPVGWAPVLQITSGQDSFAGLFIQGQDILGFHKWAAQPLYYYDNDIKRFGGTAIYDFYNRITLSAVSQITIAEIDARSDNVVAWDNEKTYQALVRYPINKIDWALEFSLGMASENIKTTIVSSDTSYTVNNALIGSGIRFNNLEIHPQGISVTNGILANFTIETYDAVGSSGNSGNAYIGELDGYINIGKKNTLKLSALYGTGGKNIKPFRLGSSSDRSGLVNGITQLGRRDFSLRGYDRHPELSGVNIARGIAEWRLPIAMIYDGWSVFPLGLGKIWSNLFVDAGSAWDNGENKTLYTGVGMELGFEIQLGFDSILIPLVIGAAKGLDSELGDNQFYIKMNFVL